MGTIAMVCSKDISFSLKAAVVLTFIPIPRWEVVWRILWRERGLNRQQFQPWCLLVKIAVWLIRYRSTMVPSPAESDGGIPSSTPTQDIICNYWSMID